MLYRWGFIEEGVFTECKPIVDDDASIDFAQETGQIFYRGKLNGSLAFRFEFDAILAKGYNYTHIVVLQWYDNSDDTWKECWRGIFSLTDCEIDYDTNTISVQPETRDRYTDILNNLETEYNLIKLSAKMQPVNILLRPCTQIYLAGNTRVSNYVGGNSWDAECELANPQYLYSAHWQQLKNCFWFYCTYTSGQYAGKYAVYYGLFDGPDAPGSLINISFPMQGRVYNTDGTYVEDNTLQCKLDNIVNPYLFAIKDSNDSYVLRVYYDWIQDDYGDNYESYEEGAMIENSYFSWDRPYGRTICQSDLDSVVIGGTTYNLEDIADMDIASNYNYNKFIKYVAAEVLQSINTSADPTGWPESANHRYFIKPQNTATRKYFPIAAESWQSVSYWFYTTSMVETLETLLIATRTIRDSYELRYAVMRLLQKANWQGQYFISGILGGSQDYAGFRFLPVITAKSNVISSYYDTPAQNAPISLAKIFSMLKQAYRIYWYIDENDNIHLEHISYFDNGNNYTETEPQLLIDLESKIHTRTYESKVFGQNKVKYDKNDMPQQFTFSWMDKQTMAFQGFPINCLDQYVNKGSKEDNNIGDFDTDVDYILTAPSEISKDGFVLFALPFYNNAYRTTLRIETIHVKDENGDDYDLKVQNAEGAFAKIHENMWRYDLPCENVNINNEDTTARTTGRYKLQSIEFADEVMAEILKEISNCIKPIRTQQGDGHIKNLSINLNSLAAKADLLFNFIGRWYYLRGTALGNNISIYVNGELVTIEVSDNVFKYRYNTPISALTFNAADVVSVNFADADNLDNLTSTEDMFKNCAELLAVDFGNKKFGAVTDATDMFAGCAQLSTLICPATSTWKPDLNFEDCPLLTTESIYSLIEYLFTYESGSHTLTFNQTMWNALDPDVQTDIEAKANAKGWQIAMAAAYFITGQSPASVVYATINGSAVEIDVENGVFSYGYRNPITSISFEGDGNVTDIDFSLSDGLAGLTSLDNAFKNCAGLTSIDFTNCDLSNVVSASDAFANCGALYTLEIPTGTWKPDIDLSASVMPKTEMLNVIDGLFTYNTGTHTITFNSTIWDAMPVADQQIVFDAADAKGWTTNAVAVVYYIKGKSTAASETFTLQFIDDLLNVTTETITCAVDANGDWKHEYQNKKIYSLNNTFKGLTTITEIEFNEDMNECTTLGNNINYGAFQSNANLTSVLFPNGEFKKCTTALFVFYNDSSLTTIDLSKATFELVTNAFRMFQGCAATTINLQSAKFTSLISAQVMFANNTSVTSIDLSSADFTALQNAQQMFTTCSALQSITFKNGITFANVTQTDGMFNSCSALTSISLPNATFASCTKTGATNSGMFGNTASMQTINLPSAIFGEVTDPQFMFYNCKALTIDLSSATFAKATNCFRMFQNATRLQSLSMPEATFGLTTLTQVMFSGCNAVTNISMPKATFASVTNANAMFSACRLMTTLDLSLATMANVSDSGSMFYQNNVLANVVVPNTASFPINISLSAAPLTYASMVYIADWLKDLTGLTAQTITFKSTAWNALSAAEQATITGILNSKNWTLATA